MSAKQKLNSANVVGVVLVAGLLGAVTGSWAVFTVAAPGLVRRRLQRRRHPPLTPKSCEPLASPPPPLVGLRGSRPVEEAGEV